MTEKLNKRIIHNEKPLKREAKISLFIAFVLFLSIAVVIAITSGIPLLSKEEPVETTIEYAFMDLIEVGEFGGSYTVVIEATDGKVYKIDSLLTKRMDLDALETFLFSEGEIKLTLYNRNWILGIAAEDNVFLDANTGLEIMEHNRILNLMVFVPFFVLISLSFLIPIVGTGRIKSFFRKNKSV